MKYDLTRKDVNPFRVNGSVRRILHKGRSGLHATSIRSRIELPKHTLAGEKGAAAIWFMPLEDMTSTQKQDSFQKHNQSCFNYPLLIDSPDYLNEDASRFCLAWNTFPHPQFYARFYSGNYHNEVFQPQQKAFTAANGISFLALHWYQVIVTWDHLKQLYRLYVNGVLAGNINQFREVGVPAEVYYETAQECLYTGSPMFAVSSVEFFDHFIDSDAVSQLYQSQQVEPETEEDARLARLNLGHGLRRFDWEADDQWQTRLKTSLTEPEDLNLFYIQGMTDAPSISPGEGLRVQTYYGRQPMIFDPHLEDKRQVYLWTEQAFEGDLHVSLEFKSLLPGGLSLLMFQSSGMQREDFMADYPRRTDGSMKMVGWEDVRNYQWEYYREMNDTRNDVASHYFKKNPYVWPLAYQCTPNLLSDGEWHRLDFLQEGSRLRGAIDGVTVFDCHDNSHVQNGPVYSFGRVAIRCMLRTHMLFRNLTIKNRKHFQTVEMMGNNLT